MDDQPIASCIGNSKCAITETFNNVVVWRNLSNFLNLSDLKCLRLTCKHFNDHVLNSTNFKSRTVVNILQNRVTTFGTTTTLWKNLMIPYEGPNATEYEKTDSLVWFYPLLANVEILTIIAKNYNPGKKCLRTYPSLEKLLEAPTSLKMLAIDVAILKAPETPVALELLTEKALSNLNNLNGLHMMECFNMYDFYPPGDNIFRSSTKLLLPLLKNLSTVIIEYINIASDYPDEPTIQLSQNLIQIILNNRDHIIDLKIDEPRLWSRRCKTNLLTILDSDIIFPRLQSLRMVALNCQEKYIADFLRRQPNLKDLDMTIHDQFPNELMKVIQERSRMLKRLRIRTKGFEKFVEDRWVFLSGLQFLEDFQLDFTNSMRFDENCGKHLLKTVMTNLPSSIKKISVQSYCSQSDGYLVPSDFVKIKEDKLTHFRVKVSDTIRNSTLKFIFNNFKNLEHLHIRGSTEKCTDFGFTGNTENDSINKLQGLKSLKFDCYNLSNTTFKEICLNDLKVLELGLPYDESNEEMTHEGSEGLRILLKRNRCLEIIRTSSTDEFVDFPSLTELQKLNPRIRCHVVPGGFDPERLHEIENDPYQSDNPHADDTTDSMGDDTDTDPIFSSSDEDH